jgi:hydrogenase nickel incorporation protein HypA/HybF
MHELSIALRLVDIACEKAAALGDVQVDALYVRLGAFSGVVKEALSFCFESAARGSAIEGARLEIEELPLVAFCPRCSAERRLAGVQLCCPVCGEPTPEIVAGGELELTALEVTDHAPHR